MDLFDNGNYRILQGDNRKTLQTLPEQSVNCVVTSPPYYGLRTYLGDNEELAEYEVGKEQTPKEFIANLVEVFREVRRVLRDDGVLWVNIGDTYSSYKDGAYTKQSIDKDDKDRPTHSVPNRMRSIMEPEGFKDKELIGIPWMLAFALREDGWYLRQDIVWSKTSAYPESVKDRCTRSHEYIFMLTKKPHYYFDNEAIKEETVDGKGLKNKRSVWTMGTSKFKGAHFATFPEELVEPCILSSCPPDGVVLDPFNGAATTGVVAIKNGVKYLGCELNPEYVTISEERLDGVVEEVESTTNVAFDNLFGKT